MLHSVEEERSGVGRTRCGGAEQGADSGVNAAANECSENGVKPADAAVGYTDRGDDSSADADGQAVVPSDAHTYTHTPTHTPPCTNTAPDFPALARIR